METTTATTDSEQLALVLRIADSRYFAKSPMLREFLLYVCDRAAQGCLDEITEPQIGTRVFGRKPGYDTGADNIVRVEARQLRRRLDAYFSGEGLAETTIIAVPKGAYVPVFQVRDPSPVTPADDADAADPASGAKASLTRRWVWFALGVGAVLLASLVIPLARKPTPLVLHTNGSAMHHALWSAVLGGRQETMIVVSDSSFAMVQDLAHASFGLDDYVSRRYLDAVSNRVPERLRGETIGIIAARRYTSMGTVSLANQILSLNIPGTIRPALRFARDVQLRDVRSRNVVLLGSARSNPWVELYKSRMAFQVDHNNDLNLSVVRNEKPQPGEQSLYSTHKAGEASTTYAVIAMLPNLDGVGRALIIAGTTSEATEAAGEFLTQADLCETIGRKLGFRVADDITPFEVLIKLDALLDSSKNAEIIAARRHTESR